MNIQYAILGFLSWRPFTGYDLKKLFANSTALYWSGNSNQIYTTLVQLHKDGLVTQEIQYQESLPARKVYSLTESGRKALKQWVRSTPELPEVHNMFLVQLTWADVLGRGELDALLESYAEETRLRLLMLQEQVQRQQEVSPRSRREAYLWEMVAHNIHSVYENELAWVSQVREGLKGL